MARRRRQRHDTFCFSFKQKRDTILFFAENLATCVVLICIIIMKWTKQNILPCLFTTLVIAQSIQYMDSVLIVSHRKDIFNTHYSGEVGRIWLDIYDWYLGIVTEFWGDAHHWVTLVLKKYKLSTFQLNSLHWSNPNIQPYLVIFMKTKYFLFIWRVCIHLLSDYLLYAFKYNNSFPAMAFLYYFTSF